jgi:hypothetical protein
MFPKRFIHADDLDGKHVTLTIKAVYQEKLTGKTDSKKDKPADTIISFAETEREYVLNPTNGTILRELWGKYADEWEGHKITIAPIPDPSGLSRSGLRIQFVGSPELDKPQKVMLPGGFKPDYPITLTKTPAKKSGDTDAGGRDSTPTSPPSSTSPEMAPNASDDGYWPSEGAPDA